MIKSKSVDIQKSCLELARLMKDQPGKIDYKLIKEGEKHLGFFQDNNYTDQFMDLKSLKKDILLLCAEDVSRGSQILQTSILGVTFHLNKLKKFVVPHGNNPEGSLVFSVSWKNIRAFLNWRNGNQVDVPQPIIDQCLYLLCFKLSELVD
ncbi:MAG: hypothetical protein NZ480_09315 [Bdellovibrionaceae bacterium]|nr:hypothetical protein [Pseudobdellovibrionaceae bacterium]MDW8189747.1 hypothetical protein [Pseudobdellovibrionaceae bacterium]